MHEKNISYSNQQTDLQHKYIDLCLFDTSFVQGVSEQTIYIFSGIIELLWTSNRNNENEPIAYS